MPSKTKNKSVFNKKHLAVVFFVVTALVALVIFTINTVRHNRNQELLIRDLNSSGLALDALAEELEAAIPGIEPVRSENCYRASRKFSEGPINCRQNIDFIRENIGHSKYLEEVSEIKHVLANSEKLSFGTPKKNGGLTEVYAETDHRWGGCRVYLSDDYGSREAYTSKTPAGYEFQIQCVSGDFDEFIYPELDD